MVAVMTPLRRDAYRLMRVSRRFVAYMATNREPPKGRPGHERIPAETVDQVEAWLWLQAHEWSRMQRAERRRHAALLIRARRLVEGGRLNDE